MKTDLFDQLCRLQTLQKASRYVPDSEHKPDLTSLCQKLKSGMFRLGRPHFKEKSKRLGGVRLVAVLSPEDQIIGMAVAMVLAPFLDRRQPDNSYAYRLVKNAKSRHLFAPHDLKNRTCENWDEKDWYAHFAGTGRRWIETLGYAYVARTDVAAFADHICHGPLLVRLRKEIKDDQFLNFLATLLRAWHPTHVIQQDQGLPQDVELASFLGNYYLLPIDDRLVRLAHSGKIKYARYMDDLWTFSRTRDGAQRVQRQIERILRGLGLKANIEKTKIFKTDEILAMIDRQRAVC